MMEFFATVFNFISQAISFNEEFSFDCSGSRYIAGITENIATLLG